MGIRVTLYLCLITTFNINVSAKMEEEHAEAHTGLYPDHLQNLQGKELKICFIGGPPYILYDKLGNLIGGSDVKIVEIFAQKFNFNPKYVSASSYDIVQGDGSSMLHQVGY